MKKIALVMILSLMLIIPAVSMAQIPQKINYQGYLSDGSGAAYDSSANPGGTVQITFRIHSIVGILWNETQEVAVNNGIYYVVLGSVNPLNLAFNIPYELGVAVGSDPEMLPLQPLTAVPYALNSTRAGDADTLDGKHGNAFAASSHPHSATDITSGVLPNAVIPDEIVRREKVIGIVTENDGKGSGVDADLLDGRDSESFAGAAHAHGGSEITSGTVADARIAASIARDNEVLAIVKAGDGSGSGIDADLLDSMHASDIIDAASDEVRTAISSCQTITTPGSYYLTGNLSAAGTCIYIMSSNVTLDMMGFLMAGNGSAGSSGVITVNVSNVEIENGTVTNFHDGINLYNSNGNAHSNRVINVQAMTNANDGIIAATKNNRIENCTASKNGGNGIAVQAVSLIKNNIAYANLKNGIEAGSSSTIIHNTAYDNSMNGISGGSGSTVTGNTVSANHLSGLYFYGSNTITDNTARSNKGTGIHVSGGNKIFNNTVGDNDATGIDAGSQNQIVENTVTGNNVSQLPDSAGIWVSTHNMVKANLIHTNRINGILIQGRGNIIEDNFLAAPAFLPSNGLNFTESGNLVSNNRSHGSTPYVNLENQLKIGFEIMF